jgi:hypothetical protein
MRIFIILTALVLSSAANAQREPETPSVEYTVNFINNYTTYGVSLDGTTFHAPNSKYDRSLDLLNAEDDAGTMGARPSNVFLGCKGTPAAKCIMATALSDDSKVPEHLVHIEISCPNTVVAEKVANALNHLIRLLQQQENDRAQ